MVETNICQLNQFEASVLKIVPYLKTFDAVKMVTSAGQPFILHLQHNQFIAVIFDILFNKGYITIPVN